MPRTTTTTTTPSLGSVLDDYDDSTDSSFFCGGGTKTSAAAEAVLDRDAFLDKPFFLVHDHWTHQQMLSSSRVPARLAFSGIRTKLGRHQSEYTFTTTSRGRLTLMRSTSQGRHTVTIRAYGRRVPPDLRSAGVEPS